MRNGNQDSWLNLPSPAPMDGFVPSRRVSVVVPYYMAPSNLRLVIGALRNQTYPQHLLEIIVVDDGSDPPLLSSDVPPGVNIVRQERNGQGTARARHAGASAATGDILLFLDGDVLLHPCNIMEHARWHTAGRHIFTIGELLCVDTREVAVDDPCVAARLLKGDESVPHHRLGWHMTVTRWTRDFTRDCDNLFLSVAGYNYSVDSEMYLRWELGKHSECFQHWGLEDSYVAYRAYEHGAVFVPVHDAKCWHLGLPKHPGELGQDVKLSAALMEQLAPHPMTRNPVAGRRFTVPRHVITVQTGDADILCAAVLDLLADTRCDAIIRADLLGMDAQSNLYVRRRLQSSPGVVLGSNLPGSLLEYPDSPLHVHISTDAPLKPGLLRRLLRTWRATSEVGFSAQDDECCIVMARARHLHQAEMGLPVARASSVDAGKFTSRRVHCLNHHALDPRSLDPMKNRSRAVRRRLMWEYLRRMAGI